MTAVTPAPSIIKAAKRGIISTAEAVRCLCTLFVETQTTKGVNDDIELALKLIKEG